MIEYGLLASRTTLSQAWGETQFALDRLWSLVSDNPMVVAGATLVVLILFLRRGGR